MIVNLTYEEAEAVLELVAAEANGGRYGSRRLLGPVATEIEKMIEPIRRLGRAEES